MSEHTINMDGRRLVGGEWTLPEDFATEETERGELPSLKGSTPLDLPTTAPTDKEN